MDNVTHSLFALTLARTRLNRSSTQGTVTLLLASNMPDIDIVATAGGATKYLEWHRGITHGPLGMVGLAVITAGLVWGVGRWRRADAEGGPAFLGLAGIALAGTICHVLMDLPTSYGTRIFAPFDWHWYAADWMPIVDVYLLVALAAGLYFGNRLPAARTRNVILVLSLMLANYGLRGAMHHRALTLAPRLFGPTLPVRCNPSIATGSPIDRWPTGLTPAVPDGSARCLVEIAAMPAFLSPFEWRVVAQMSNAYEMQEINVLSPRFLKPADDEEVLWRLLSRYPNRWTPAATDAARTRTAGIFLGFSRFPVVRTFEDPTGATTVRMTDVRFMFNGPLRPGPAAGGRGRANETPVGFFTVTVRLDSNGRVVEEHLGE